MNMMTVDSPEFASLPRTIRVLIEEVTAIGGQVTNPVARRFEFLFPMRAVGGAIHLVNRAAVGYYVENGKNVIGGSRKVREETAYWARQSR
jgi:hypothetical protein